MAKSKAPVKEVMKARGVRFTALQWKNLSTEAKKIKGTPSDIVREMTDERYSRNETKQEKK